MPSVSAFRPALLLSTRPTISFIFAPEAALSFTGGGTCWNLNAEEASKVLRSITMFTCDDALRPRLSKTITTSPEHLIRLLISTSCHSSQHSLHKAVLNQFHLSLPRYKYEC